MSDLMLTSVLRMPYEMAMEGELSRRQLHARAQQAAAEIDRLNAEIERLREIEREWFALSQDDGKAQREIDRLREDAAKWQALAVASARLVDVQQRRQECTERLGLTRMPVGGWPGIGAGT